MLCFAYVSVIFILCLLVDCCGCFVCCNTALLVVFLFGCLLFVLRLANHYFAIYFVCLKVCFTGGFVDARGLLLVIVFVCFYVWLFVFGGVC